MTPINPERRSFFEAADTYRYWAVINRELPVKVGGEPWRRMVCDTLADPLRALGWSLSELCLEAERRAFGGTVGGSQAYTSTSPASPGTHRRLRKALAALNCPYPPLTPGTSPSDAPGAKSGGLSWLW